MSDTRTGPVILQQLRDHIKEHSLDAYVLYHTDAHQSEYIAPCDERIAFISGFRGSNALCVVTQDKALMWTDGRYYLAA
jgi:Xaa-Pro aminopeptidase